MQAGLDPCTLSAQQLIQYSQSLSTASHCKAGQQQRTVMRMLMVAECLPPSERGASMGSSQSCVLLGVMVESRRRSLPTMCGGFLEADVRRLTPGWLNRATTSMVAGS